MQCKLRMIMRQEFKYDKIKDARNLNYISIITKDQLSEHFIIQYSKEIQKFIIIMLYKGHKKLLFLKEQRAKTEANESESLTQNNIIQKHKKIGFKLSSDRKCRRQLSDFECLNNDFIDINYLKVNSNKYLPKKLQFPKIEKLSIINKQQTQAKTKILDQQFQDFKKNMDQQFRNNQQNLQQPLKNLKMIQQHHFIGIRVRSQQKKKREKNLAPIILENHLLNRQNKYLKICRNKIFSIDKKQKVQQQIKNITFFPTSNNKKNVFVV